MFIYNYNISHDLLMKNVAENVKHLGDGNALEIEKLLEASAKVPETMAHILGDDEYVAREIIEYLELIVGSNREIFGSCMAFEPYGFTKDSLYFAPYVYKGSDGLVKKFLHSPDQEYFTQEWYEVPINSREPHWSEPYFDEGGGEILMCTYSVPVFAFEEQEKLIGVVTIDLSLEWLKEFVHSIEAYERGYAFLISAKGTIITDPRRNADDLVNILQIAEERDYDVLKKAARDMIDGGSDFIPYESTLVDEKSWMYYTPLPSAGWSLALIIPESEFMTDLDKLNRDLLFIGVAGILLLMIIVVIISRRIAQPLTGLVKVAKEIGQGDFDTQLPHIRSQDEIGQLNLAVGRMQEELKEYMNNLQATTAAKEKIESELQIARDIQQGIIPKIFPPFPDRDNLDLYAVLDPARDVGGDLYDFFFIDDKHLCFAIGDVSGKGVPASLFMAITRTLLRARMSKGVAVNEVTAAMNNELCLENENAMFVTLFLGILDVESGKLTYSNAGHNYPLILNRSGQVIELKATHGTPLGAMPDMPFGTSSIDLGNHDTILLYTDGVSEAIDKDEEQYSEQRLREILSGFKDAKPETITRSIINDLNTFVGEADQFDDITMLVISWFKEDKN
jgi:sigma-B regulation protein RsbU (phosphoserine phosphatase)